MFVGKTEPDFTQRCTILVAMDINCGKRKFLLGLRKNFFMLNMKVSNIGIRAQRGCEISIIGDKFKIREFQEGR